MQKFSQAYGNIVSRFSHLSKGKFLHFYISQHDSKNIISLIYKSLIYVALFKAFFRPQIVKIDISFNTIARDALVAGKTG